jgi:hypothetical protein
MYNLNSHYENIFHYLNSIIADPRLLYLMPYGSTEPENIERLMNELGFWPGDRGPLFVLYDQEPILGEFNFKLLDHVCNNYLHGDRFILVTTEKDSETVELIRQRYNCPVIYYFHHVFAAHDWYRGIQFDSRLVEPAKRKLKKKYISFNRLTSNLRVYRSLFISEIIEREILDQGYVSYNDTCPDGGTYQENLQQAVNKKLIAQTVADQAVANINSIQLPLRIDYRDEKLIPNSSFVLSAVPETQESFVYVVTETCYWEHKCHLTEKIFKPIVSRMPFVLVGPAHNLAYLRSYGFRTFGDFWDEGYDDIEDPMLRMQSIGRLLESICQRTLLELEHTLAQIQEILDHNYRLFYSQEFIDGCWSELTLGLSDVCEQQPTVPGLQEAINRYLAKSP